jgi:hypothetical protein
VIAAKAATSIATGMVFGLLAAALADAVGATLMSARGVTLHVQASDYARLIAGGAAAAALWAVMGVSVGAVVRNQVAAIVGIFVCLQIVENILADSASAVSRYLPGALGQALAAPRSGLLHSPALALLLLVAVLALVIALHVVTCSGPEQGPSTAPSPRSSSSGDFQRRRSLSTDHGSSGSSECRTNHPLVAVRRGLVALHVGHGWGLA